LQVAANVWDAILFGIDQYDAEKFGQALFSFVASLCGLKTDTPPGIVVSWLQEIEREHQQHSLGLKLAPIALAMTIPPA
jgi:hypothetical protein